MNHATTGAHGASHGSVKSYLTGFFLSIVLTLIPFILVMDGSASYDIILSTVVALAILQIIVHFIYFLHMNGSSEERWNLISLIFSILLIVIVVGGSLWIMHHLDVNMMVD